MKVSEVIALLNELPQDEVVYLLNGVSGGGPITLGCFGWDTHHKSPGRMRVYDKEDSSSGRLLTFQGPVKPVFCIYGE